MYGLKPTDIDRLSQLRGKEITQICIGPHDLQFNFHPKGNVSVWGRCELLNATGDVLDAWEDDTHSGVFRFPEILKVSVSEVAIDSPKSFVLKFANGLGLRLVDNSEQYESFSVGDLYV
jgi:hypothetical protein